MYNHFSKNILAHYSSLELSAFWCRMHSHSVCHYPISRNAFPSFKLYPEDASVSNLSSLSWGYYPGCLSLQKCYSKCQRRCGPSTHTMSVYIAKPFGCPFGTFAANAFEWPDFCPSQPQSLSESIVTRIGSEKWDKINDLILNFGNYPCFQFIVHMAQKPRATIPMIYEPL